MHSLQFNNGLLIPSIGIGTWNVPADKVYTVLSGALLTGYRHIDCAYFYRNEPEVGAALEQCLMNLRINRQDLFITSKVHDTNVSKYPPKKILAESIKHTETWKEMEKLVDDGLVKSIGVSNFNKHQLDNIMANCRIKPVNLQIEIHANFPNLKLVQYAQSLGLTVTAYAPLGSPANRPGKENLLTQPRICSLADKYHKTSAQILLRYLLDRGLIVIPKSLSPTRIEENFQVFDFHLTPEEVEMLNTSGLNERQFKALELSEHPDYPFHDEY